MPIFGNIGLILGTSSSLTTSSIPVLPLYVGNPSYGLTGTASLAASINATILTQSSAGAAAEITFNLPSPENANTAGFPILKLYATGSNNEPRVGIGFEEGEEPIKAFDIKSKTENNKGTELLIRSSRVLSGAQIGDEAGIINFVIDTGSFIDITTTGSIARIKTKVDSVSQTGVAGRLQFGLTRNTDTEVDIIEMSYGDSTFADFYATTTPRTFEIKDINPQTTSSQNASFIHSNGTNPYTIIRTDNPGTGGAGGLIQVNNKFGTGTIFLHGPTGEITGSDVIIDDWGSISASLASASLTFPSTQATFHNSGQTSLTTTTDQYYHYAGSRQYGYSIGIFDMYSLASPTTLTTGAGSYMKAGYVVPEDGTYDVNFAVRAFVSSQTTSDVTAAEYQGQSHDFLVIRSQPSSGNPNMSIITSASVEFNSSDSSFPVTGSVEFTNQTLSKGDLLIIGIKGTTNASSNRYLFHSHTLTLNK